MSNFRIFDKAYLDPRINAFLPGAANHITPIRYEAITPDLFCFLFRTTGDGGDYYFILLEFDYLSDIQQAKEAVESWHGAKLIEWMPPAQFLSDSDDDVPNIDVTLRDYVGVYADPYTAMLARVERPRGHGYWATNIVVMPGDNINEKLAHLPKKQRLNVKKMIIEASRYQAEPKTDSFLDVVTKNNALKSVDPESLDTNTTDMAFSVYAGEGDNAELFYNWANTKSNSRRAERKPPTQ